MASSANHAEPQKDLLILLERTRDVYGNVPEHAVTGLAHRLGIPVADVYATATFYRGLPLWPVGKHLIKVCKSVPCYLKHNGPVVDALADELGIAPGETTPDGLFSFDLVNCIGACDKAPAMMIDDDVYGDLTPVMVKEILARYS